jgi:hypothetical protein
MKKYLLLLILLIAFAGCTTTQNNSSTTAATTVEKKNPDELPQWFYTPTMGQYKYGGVGIAKKSAHGPSRQRQLAIGRAIDEIASQMNTKVSSVQEFVTTKNSTDYSGYSIHTTDGQVVNAILMEIWVDRRKEELYAWLVVEK